MGFQNHVKLGPRPEPGVLSDHPAVSPALQRSCPGSCLLPGSPEHWVRKQKHISQMFILAQAGTKQGRPGLQVAPFPHIAPLPKFSFVKEEPLY